MADRENELADRVMQFVDEMLRGGHDPESVGATLAAAGVTVLRQFGGDPAVVQFLTKLADSVAEQVARDLPES